MVFFHCLFFSPSGISVSISTFSLVAIAIERYSAICNPLKSRSWQTRSHAYRVITATWVLSLLIMVPYPVFSVLRSFPKANNTVGHMCRLDWPSPQAEQTWWVCCQRFHLHRSLNSSPSSSSTSFTFSVNKRVREPGMACSHEQRWGEVVCNIK